MAYLSSMNEQSPIVSEFETVEQADAYARWLRDKVATSLADPRPSVSHDKAMSRAKAILKDRRD